MVRSLAPTIPVQQGLTIPTPSYEMSPSVLHVMLANTAEPMDLALFQVSVGSIIFENIKRIRNPSLSTHVLLGDNFDQIQ